MSLESQLIEKLEAELDEMRERVRQLEEMLATPSDAAALLFGLSPYEARFFDLLFRREFVAKEQAMTWMYAMRRGREPDIKILNVYVHKLRAKLRRFGIEIRTLPGQGYFMPAASKRAAAELMHDNARTAA